MIYDAYNWSHIAVNLLFTIIRKLWVLKIGKTHHEDDYDTTEDSRIAGTLI